MDFEAALRARIIAAGTAAEARVYWLDRPQGAELPSITLQMISGDYPMTYGGLQGTRSPRVQLDVWADSHLHAQEIEQAVIAALSVGEIRDGVRFEPMRFENERDGLERIETQNIYRRGIDLIAWHSPA